MEGHIWYQGSREEALIRSPDGVLNCRLIVSLRGSRKHNINLKFEKHFVVMELYTDDK